MLVRRKKDLYYEFLMRSSKTRMMVLKKLIIEN